MSEWGNPPRIFGAPHTEYIGVRGKTQGSEPSQYLQEKKSTEIPQVAASERGPAQTRALRSAGVAGPGLDTSDVSGSFWKAAPKRVTVPYAKTSRRSSGTPSRTEHVKLRLNQGGPPSKAEYSPVTDSEPVP